MGSDRGMEGTGRRSAGVVEMSEKWFVCKEEWA